MPEIQNAVMRPKIKIHSVKKRIKAEKISKFNWRTIWYSVVIWLLAIIVGGLVILPWFYLVLPAVVFWSTIIYFKKEDKNLKTGLLISLFWFCVIFCLDILELVGPYYANAQLYFSDPRNWLKYALILLVPIIYTLVSENNSSKKAHRGRPVKLGRTAAVIQ